MRTLQKQAAGAGLLAAGCSIAAAVLLLTAPPKDTQQTVAQTMVTDFSVAQVSAMAVNNSAGKLGLMPIPGGGIELVGAPPGDYSQQKLSALIYSFSHLAAERTVKQPGSDALYGLERPQASVSLILEDKSTVRLSIGRESPIDGARYLRREGDDTLYLVAAADAQLALQSAEDFRQLELFPAVTSDNLAKLERVEVSAGTGGWTVARGDSGGLYTLEAPAQAGLDWETVFEKVIRPLSALLPEGFVAEGAALEQYGLQQPAITLTVTIAGKNYRCGFAPKDAQRWYAARLDGGPVCELDAGLVAFLRQDYLSLLGSSLYSRNIVEVARICADDGKNRWTVEVSGEGETLAGQIGERVIDATALVSFYSKATAIPIAAPLEDRTAEAQPMLTLTVTLRNGGMDLLEFLPVTDRQCAVSVNGQLQFTTYTTVVRELTARFDRLARRNTEEI